MGLQKLVDDGREVEHQALYRPAGNHGLVRLARRHQCIAGGDGAAGLAPRRILYAALLARLHHLQQLAQRVEALGKAGVGIELHQNLLGLADGQARVQPLVQGGIEFGHVAGGHEGCDQRDGLLPGGQGVCGLLDIRHGVGLLCVGCLCDGGAGCHCQHERHRNSPAPSGRCIAHHSPAPSSRRFCHPACRRWPDDSCVCCWRRRASA